MAELGIVASGMGIASLALQVGDCIVRLKGFWDAVKDAPEEIKHLIEEIETLSIVLSDFETSEQLELNLGRESTSRCLQLCKKAIGVLDSVVKELGAEIKRRKRVGSVKAVLKKDVIDKMRERLMTAQSMLMLSNNMYLVELQKRNRQAHYEWAKTHQQELQQLRVIVSQSTETILCSARFQDPEKQLLTEVDRTPPGIESKSLSTDEPGLECQKFNRGAKRQLKLKARFQAPKWLFGFSRAIEIYECRAHAGWNFNIQVYNVVPYNSPIFGMVRSGDVIGIQDLFRTGQASPFDRDPSGYTVLDIAATYQKLEVCQLFINEGADPNISCRGSALALACCNWFPYTSTDAFHDLVQLLAQRVEFLDFFQEACYEGGLEAYRGDAETFAWLLQASNFTPQQRSLEECVLFALKVCNIYLQPDMARLVRTILKGREIDEYLCGIRDEDGGTLLHLAARNLGEFLSGIFTKQWAARLEDVLHLIRDLVKGSHRSDLNALADFRTPMLRILDGYLESFAFSYSIPHERFDRILREALPMPLRTWLKLLKDSGVDLVEYGKTEKWVLENSYMIREWYYCEFDKRKRWKPFVSHVRLINFTYGLEPDDWKFWFAPAMKDYFVDFWDMIDHPERAMPGAWQEEQWKSYY